MLGRLRIHRNQTLLQGEEYQVGMALQIEVSMMRCLWNSTVFSLGSRCPAICSPVFLDIPESFLDDAKQAWHRKGKYYTGLSVADSGAAAPSGSVLVDLILVRINKYRLEVGGAALS